MKLEFFCSMCIVFDLFEPMMKAKDEIWNIIHKKYKTKWYEKMEQWIDIIRKLNHNRGKRWKFDISQKKSMLLQKVWTKHNYSDYIT